MHKEIIRSMFNDVFGSQAADETVISKYFSKDYVQHVDGKTLDYEHFVKHIQTVKGAVKSLSVTVQSIAEEGNTVFTNHHAAAVAKADGRAGVMNIISEFRLRDGKIYYCNELTHLMEGDEKHKDLGSRE